MARPPLALTMGEPAGIGGELTLMAWRRRGTDHLPPFFAIDEVRRLADLAARLGLDVPCAAIERPDQAPALFDRALPVLDRPLAAVAVPGRPDPANATAVVAAIATAVALARDGQAAAVVTNPIHKGVLYRSGFRFPGHTEYLADLAGGVPVVMMLANRLLKVVPVTIHLPLIEAARTLSTPAIVEAGRITAAALRRDFGVLRPRLAVAGLNPHAGEGGALGDEDGAVVTPAVEALRAAGIDATGPWPADTLFHAEARATYDAALCMYHDQALIPVKTLDFFGGVNVTLGLPFIRTSPDHGTAFAIAGSGTARPDSLIAALRMAGEMAARRG